MSDIPYPPPPAPPIPPANATLPRSPVISPSLANATPPAGATPVRSPEDIQNERLMAFGAAMAQSNSPSFFAQLGAGFGAVNQARQQDRSEALKEREIDVMDRYRTAQIAVQEAQLAAEQDPDSPANRLRLAQAEAQLIAARASLARAGREDRARVVGQQRDADGNLYLIYDDGRAVRAGAGQGGEGGPNFVDPANTPAARRFNEWSRQREAIYGRILATPAPLGTDQAAHERQQDAAIQRWERANPRPPAPWDSPEDRARPPAAATPANPNPRADVFGRTIPAP